MRSRIMRANDISDYVYAHRLPARHTHDIRIVRLASPRGDTYAALYDYLPGVTIPWEAYTQKHIKQLGKTLSDVHAVLRDYAVKDLPSVAVEYRQVVDRMGRYFTGAGVQDAMRQKLGIMIAIDQFAALDSLLAACERLPKQQALHMDFVRSNILFTETDNGPSITGILDFEKTALGSPLFDIARTLAFLLVDCKYKSNDKVRKYFLYSGYQKRGGATLANVAVKVHGTSHNVFEELVVLFLVHDFYKFLKHNPYEYLGQNEHFVRTRDLLLKQRVLRSR